MKKYVVSIGLVLFSALPVLAGEGRVRRVGRAVPGQYIAVFDEDMVERGRRRDVINDLTSRSGARTRIIFGGFPGFSFDANDSVATAIAHDPRIAWVEENAVGEGAQTFPPGWALDRTNQAYPPLDNVGTPGCVTASGIRVYVMDTGISDPGGIEFGGRVRNLYKRGPNWQYDDEDPYRHGTAVASLAAGSRHGLARSAEVVNVKISVAGETYTDRMIDAIDYIDVDHYDKNLNVPSPRGAVVNISFYLYSGYTEAKRTALDVAVQNSVKGCSSTQWFSGDRGDGVIVNRYVCAAYKAAPAAYGLTYVVGAGNENHTVVGSPARLGDDVIGTITVGATKMAADWMSDWRGQGGTWGTLGSNYGAPVDIWAPGTDVNAYNPLNGSTKPFTGTSGASPLVAGQVARLLNAYPTYTSSQIENQLKSGAVSTYSDGTPVIRDVAGGKLFQYLVGRCRP